MLWQISSGLNSPEECEFAVMGLYNNVIKKKDKNCIDILIKKNKHRAASNEYAKSIIFDSDVDFSNMIGTIKCINKSTKPGIKRKNWFIQFSKIPEVEIIDEAIEKDITFKTTHSSGSGGQNVNKVESAVYATHNPTGITVFSSSERDQYINKRNCIKKIAAIIEQLNMENKADQKNKAWQEHNSLVRGNEVKTYEGRNFKEIK